MIREFFVNEHPKFLYKPFGLIHFIFIFIAVIGVAIVILNRNKISKIPKEKSQKILKISAWILLANMLIYTFGNLYFDHFFIDKDLPFHLCFIANYVFMFGIIFNKEELLKYTIFLCFVGPIPAVLWPDLVSTIDNFNFWQYIISHHFFMTISVFSYYALGYKVTFKNYVKTIILTNFLMFAMMPFNKAFNTNYIFSSQIPDNVLALYPWLKYFPPILVLEVVGMLISFAVYYFLIYKRNKELNQ